MYLEISERQSGKTTRLCEAAYHAMLNGHSIYITCNNAAMASHVRAMMLKISPATPLTILNRSAYYVFMWNANAPLKYFYDEFLFSELTEADIKSDGYYASTGRDEMENNPVFAKILASADTVHSFKAITPFDRHIASAQREMDEYFIKHVEKAAKQLELHDASVKVYDLSRRIANEVSLQKCNVIHEYGRVKITLDISKETFDSKRIGEFIDSL